MKILILNVTINWVYRLYEEYILSFKKFLKRNYNDVDVYIEYINSIEFDETKLTKVFKNLSIKKLLDNEMDIYKYPFHLFDKIFYSGEPGVFNDFIIPFLTKILGNSIKDKIYFINIEQLSKDSYYRLMHTIDSDIKIIDYSEENIIYLNNTYKAYLFPPFYDNFNININNKYIDVLSIINNSYREDFFKKININNFYLKKGVDNTYGFDRNTLFDNSKIYVNIHSSNEHLTMEMIRIVNLIMRKVIILSYKSIYTDILFLKKYIIICETPEEFSIKINDILSDYNNFYNTIYGNFNYYEYTEYIKNNVDKLLLS